jgi:hypothetical protein
MIDITKIRFSSFIDTFKNLPTAIGSISVPNQSYTAGQYRAFSTTIPLTKVDATTQIINNFSFSPTLHYAGSFVQVNPNANFIAQTRSRISGQTLTIDLYVANNTGGTQSVPAFTLNISVRRFAAPFNN